MEVINVDGSVMILILIFELTGAVVTRVFHLHSQIHAVNFWCKICKCSLSICAVCIFVYCIFGVCVCRSLCLCLSLYICMCTFMYACYITAPVHCNSGLWSINSLFLAVAISIKPQAPFNRQLTDDQRRACTALITPNCFTECVLLFTDETEGKKKKKRRAARKTEASEDEGKEKKKTWRTQLDICTFIMP